MIRPEQKFNTVVAPATAILAASILVATILMTAAELAAAAPTANEGYPLSLTRGSRLMIDARVNGHPVSALLDSAAEATLIDAAWAKSLHLSGGTTVTGQGSGNDNFETT